MANNEDIKVNIQTVMKKLSDIHPYENNPRNNKVAVDKVIRSIQQFGFKVPIIIDNDGTIVTGHTRYLASKKLGLKEVPCILADDLTPEQIKAYRLVDNKVSEYATWDVQMLQKELKDLEDFDLSEYDFDETLQSVIDTSEEAIQEVQPENPYTFKIQLPEYEVQGWDVNASDLVNTAQRDKLLKEIKGADIPDDVRIFLELASQRHLIFDYTKIAEFYAQADETVQDLMERSGLVIIDYDKAIQYGYMNLVKEIEELRENDTEDDEDNEG
jgi:hypothetical protein